MAATPAGLVAAQACETKTRSGAEGKHFPHSCIINREAQAQHMHTQTCMSARIRRGADIKGMHMLGPDRKSVV